MNRIDEIRKRIENFKSDYLPYFNNNGEMYEWNAMYEDLIYALSIIDQLYEEKLRFWNEKKEITELMFKKGLFTADQYMEVLHEALQGKE